MGAHVRRRPRRAALAVAVATVGGGIVQAEAPVAAAPSACPAAYPLSQVRRGQDVEGLTVERGRSPDGFTAEVLGVIEDGIAPGLDMIVADATSPAITRAGGIWAGMSGSPVYAADGRLLGAVAYGLSWGPSSIAGITPADDMYRLLDGGGPVSPARQIELPERLEQQIVSSGAASSAEAEAGMSMLSMPLGVSGLSPARQAKVTRQLTRRLPNALVYAASSAPGQLAVRPLEAGGNVASALSFGDITFAGVGTVTAVCGDEALLFGHPFNFAGRTSMSAHQANALFVQPETLGSPFKVANPGGLVGTVDEDRLAGLHTSLGDVPASAPMRSRFTGTETGISRTSTTRVVDEGFAPIISAYHTFLNLDRVADRIGGGVVEVNWAAQGRRADGSRWRLARRELVANRYDTSFEAGFAIYGALSQLLENDFEDVTLESVRMNGTSSPEFNGGTIVGLQRLGSDGRWRPVQRGARVELVAGSDAFFRAVIDRFQSTRTSTVQFAVRVPRAVGARGDLAVIGGGGGFFFFEGATAAGGAGDGFERLLERLRSQPTGDTITAELSLRDDDRRIRRTTRTTASRGVEGFRSVRVEVVAPGS